MKKVIIFDLDGVIIDSHDVMRAAFLTSCQAVIGGRREEHLKYFCEFQKHMGRGLKEILQIMKLPEEMQPLFIKTSYGLMDKIKIYDGISDLLGRFKKKITN